MKADPFPAGGPCNAGCATSERPPTHPYPQSTRGVATADDDNDSPRPQRDACGRMSQMAGEGAGDFYSIVVIDFIMSDIQGSLAAPSQGGKACEGSRGPDAYQTHLRSIPPI